ncbi:MAG: hypothetical protein ABI921_07365 [Panacibacter sp.]
MNNLQGKHILFFAPRFFGYEKEITNKLTALGAYVDYYDERPGNSILSKALLRLHAGSMANTISTYYKKVIDTVKGNHYDFVFVVNAEAITPEIISEMRLHFGTAKFILYMWDSMRNKKNTLTLHKSFDCTYSFDRLDAENIPGINFRPLFFCDDYKPCTGTTEKYDLAFTGTGHADRFTIIDKIKKYAVKDSLSLFTFLYLHSPLIYFYLYYKDKEFRRKASMKYFSFKPLKKEQMISIICSSKAVIDIQHPNQIGLTMRTFELMALDKKIVTTNPDIVNYDFYMPENVYVIDRNAPYIDAHFFTTPFKAIPAEIKQQYSIEAWLLAILK